MKRFNPDSKRTKSAILFFTYGVMTISTILISTIALLFALGYRLDNESLTVEQGGLLQFVSEPTGATIDIDGKRQSFQTPNKATVESGKHEVSMQLKGYRSWSKTISVAAGEIHWLNYVRFIPDNVTTTSVREFDAVHDSLASPNKRYIVIQPSATEPRLLLANIRNENEVTYEDLQLPAESYTPGDGQPHNFEIVEWNLDGRFLLIRHKVGTIEEFLRFDRQNPSEVINLSSKFGAITQAQFAGNNGNVIYATINNELRRIPVAATQTELLASGVQFFTVYRGDTLGFIADRNEQREVGIIKADRETIVKEFRLTTPVTIALSSYFNRDYMAISSNNEVNIIREPADARTAVAPVIKSFKIDQPVIDWLYFSNNGRFIVAQNQANFTTYDLERREAHKRSFNTSQRVTQPFKWLDDYYLRVDLDNNLRIVEFDGGNERGITSVVTGQTVTLSDNADVIFSFGRNNGNNKIQLQRSGIVLE